MKAIACTAYGPPEVLHLIDAPKPVPRPHEVLVRIDATTVTASDCILRGFKLPRWSPTGVMMGLVVGIKKPRRSIIGLVLSGEVEAAGKAVVRLKPGDAVYAFTMLRFGAYAEYSCLPENSVIAPKPANLSHEEAAAIPYGGLLALHYLNKGGIQRGQRVLVYGASGAIGTAAVQLAKHFGAIVTGVCSTSNVEMVKGLGADHVIDYTREDFTTGGASYDLILDAVGKQKSRQLASKTQCQKVLAPDGTYLSVDDGSPKMHRAALMRLTELVEAGHLKPVIDRRYPLEEIVEAHRYVDAGHKKGNVIITVAHGE